MKPQTSRPDWRKLPPVVAGIGLLVAAAALAPQTWEVLTSARSGRALWLLLNLGVACLGAALLCGHRRTWAPTLAIIVLNTVLLGGLVGELAIRAGIHFNLAGLRKPALYAGWHYDEEFWQLRHRWQRKPLPTEGEFLFDPQVGWVTVESRRLAEDGGDQAPGTVLVYGDSFTQGVPPTTDEERIPALLGKELAGEVHNYATSGYGIDQIYLRLLGTSSRYERPTLVIGLLTDDIDRALFRVRDAPKPRFVLAANDSLELTNVPLPEDPERWYSEHPPRMWSYLGAFLWQQLIQRTDPLVTELVYRRLEKQQLATALLEATVKLAREEDATLLFVLFYGEWELGFEGWRERFLKQEFARLGVPVLDTKPLFLNYAAAHGVPVSSLYFPTPNQHPRPLGNRVVARAIADQLRELPR